MQIKGYIEYCILQIKGYIEYILTLFFINNATKSQIHVVGLFLGLIHLFF